MNGAATWWKRSLAGLAILAVASAVFVATWLQSGSRPVKPLVEEAKLLLPRPVAVAPGVYLLGKMTPAAAYVVETSGGLVLVDSGLQADAATLTGQMAGLGLDVTRLKAILLTHVHADHSLGAAHLRSRTGAKVYAGRADCPPLRKGDPRVAFFSTFSMPEVAVHPTTVDVELVGDEMIEVGDTRFTALAMPGHTPGSVCYQLERNGLRILFTGDVIQSLSPETKDALGTYAAYLPPAYRGDARDYLATLRRLRGMPQPDLVLPGHPGMDAKPQNPRLTPEQWHGLLDRGIRAMELLLVRRKADGANFLDGIPKELLSGLHYLGDFGGTAVYCLSTPKGLFLFNAPGGPALVEFLVARFKDLGWEGRKSLAIFVTSAEEQATAGLAELVRKTGCAVVAPKAGLDSVRRACPDGAEILTEDDLGKKGWFEVRAIPLRGRGRAPMAYQLRWAGKTVLISGRIPVKLNTESVQYLLREVAGPEGNASHFQDSLDVLKEVMPDLWLPAISVHGQNANVYDREWADVLDQNGQMFSR